MQFIACQIVTVGTGFVIPYPRKSMDHFDPVIGNKVSKWREKTELNCP
jgi:hypothetical protein